MDDLRYERLDVIIGSVLTGVIGFFVVVTCATTLHVRGVVRIPLPMLPRPDAPGGIVRALPVCDRSHRGRDSRQRRAAAVYRILPIRIHGARGCTRRRLPRCSVFYGSYLGVAGLALVIVLLPGVPLIGVLILSQVLNAILLLPLLVFMYLLARDLRVIGTL